MRLKHFRARDIAGAMAQVRAELGAEALILSTRRVGDGVELTAALDGPPPPAVVPTDPAQEAALSWHGVPPPLAQALLQFDLTKTLRDRFSFAPLPLAPGEPPLLLTGPPGSGKTLTVAKLATRLTLAGQRPLIVTVDGKRAGAVEQLAAFTRLLGLQLVVAHNPLAVARALTRRQGNAPVILDGPGTDPFDPAQRDELAAIAESAAARTALVLPAGLCAAEAGDVAESYAKLGASLLVATRLDVTRRLGGVLAAADAGRLSLAEGGTSAGAMNGLVALTPESLAERLVAAAVAGRPQPQRNAA